METRSAAKKRKLSTIINNETSKEDDGIDRISELPDAILHHILFLLPIKTVAQTSVLSKRWKSLWSTFPDLDFTTIKKPIISSNVYPLIIISKRFSKKSHYYPPNDPKAPDSITQVLTLRDKRQSDIRTLRFQATHLSFSRLNDIIRRAVRRNVQELDVEVGTEDFFNFPRSIISSESLRVFRMKSRDPGFRLPPPSVMRGGFRSLVSLSLSRVVFHDRPSVYDLFTASSFPKMRRLSLEDCLGLINLRVGCRALEDLALENCLNLQGLDICSENLERLRVSHCFIIDVHVNKSWIKINAPRLLFLVWENNAITDSCSIINSSKLQKASVGTASSIGVIMVPHHNEDVISVPKLQSLSNLLTGIAYAHCLTFESQCVEILSNNNAYFSVYLNPFKNLRRLELHTGFNKKTVSGLFCIFRSSPVLNTLVLKIINDSKIERRRWDRDLWDLSGSSEEELYWESQTETLKSFLHHLKIVTIHGFSECENEVSLAKFLLKHGKALEEITLLCTEDYIKAGDTLRRQKIRSQIMGFSWASSNAIITIL